MKHAIFIPSVTVGNDPEFFAVDQEGKPVAASALHMSDVRRVKKSRTDAAYGYDNVCVEINTQHRICLQEANAEVGRNLRAALYHLEGERAEPVFAPAMEFPMETIVETPAAHEFACRPSYVVADDGVTGINTPRLLPLESGLRSAGYHVHLGCGQLSNSFTARQPEAPLARLSRLLHEPSRHPELAQMCDLVSALPALLLPRDPLEAVRRDVIGYGRASEFRSPKYGFEYRALSSSMLRSPVWSWWAHSSVRDALALVVAGVDFRDKFDRAEVSHAINTADFAAAEKLWTKVKGLLATEVWPMARGHRARGGSSVVLNPKGVQYMEFQMKHGLGRTRGHKAEWLNQNSSAYHRDWRNYSCRSVPRRQGWDEFKATWTPEKNCVEA